MYIDRINRLPQVVAAVVIILFTSSCQKKFDPASYAPERPIGGYNSSAEIAAPDLVAYWSFDGNVLDSVSGSAGTAVNTSFVDGIKGQALQGSDKGYVTATPSSAIQNLTSFTIAFWMNTSPTAGAVGVFSLTNTQDFWGSIDIYFDNGGNGDTAVFKVHLNNANVPWAGQFTDARLVGAFNKWIHVTATYNAATSVFNIYENGQALGVNSAANPANTTGPVLHGDDPATTGTNYGPIKFVNATAMAFGTFQFQTNPSLTTAATAQDWARNYTGLLDEFRIYDKALSAADINALYKLEALGR